MGAKRRVSADPKKPTAIDVALRKTRPAFFLAILFSLFINILMLTGPLYMLQIYGRVIMSRNMTTLLMVTLITIFLILVYAVLEATRSRILVRAGVNFDNEASEKIFNKVQQASVVVPGVGGSQALRDLDSIREFLTGSGLLTFCDAPWVPIFIIGCFFLHAWYGVTAIIGTLVIFALALGNEFLTRRHLKDASDSSVQASGFASAALRNAEVLQAMGMVGPLRRKWQDLHASVLGWQSIASNRSGLILSGTKFTRMILQMSIYGLGGYLAIIQNLSPEMMVAASIMMGRALAPVEASVGNWRGFVSARSAYSRLQLLLRGLADTDEHIQLPRPEGDVSFEGVVAGAPGGQSPILRGVSFRLRAGETLGVVGPSGAGKSTLARVLVGVWPYVGGAVRLDGSELPHWEMDQLGSHIGYLPQDIELFRGTVRENIARFAEDCDADVIEAAKLAGVHEMIQQLPDGYETMVGDGGRSLSGGQRQRIGLARAVFRLPALIMLDEPNSNLDSVGETALAAALVALKAARRTVVVITHRPNLLMIADKTLVLANGQVQQFGSRDEVLQRFSGPQIVSMPIAQGA
ncbi:MAG TPA: type I secretion system permease/ATPase [Rhizobiaceae bacterium]|nr:type I secretion system permease/ATPase [Rhizobiaceae bacterium]